MSFFNTIRGFGRSSKKSKAQQISNNGNTYPYSNPAGSTSSVSLRTNGSPTKHPQHYSSSRPQQTYQKPLFLCQPYVRTSLVKGSFKTIVQLPKYVDYNEWLALNVFEFYTNLNQFYGVIAEYVTPEAYPTMNAGPGIDYLWMDANKKNVVLPAGAYIDYVLTWMSNKFDDQSLFPTKTGVPFPPTFLRDLKNICRQMFRIFAHIYHNHFDKFIHLSMEAHWNSFFAHFISFTKEFDLIDRREVEPLLPLIESLEQQGKIA